MSESDSKAVHTPDVVESVTLSGRDIWGRETWQPLVVREGPFFRARVTRVADGQEVFFGKPRTTERLALLDLVARMGDLVGRAYCGLEGGRHQAMREHLDEFRAKTVYSHTQDDMLCGHCTVCGSTIVFDMKGVL